MSWLQKLLPPKIQRAGAGPKKNVPEGLWSKCPGCNAVLYATDLERSAQVCLDQNLPLVCVSATGGARMQEGLFSLLQMAKTTAALTRLSARRLPFVSVLTDPTMGGVSARFAMVGDGV